MAIYSNVRRHIVALDRSRSLAFHFFMFLIFAPDADVRKHERDCHPLRPFGIMVHRLGLEFIQGGKFIQDFPDPSPLPFEFCAHLLGRRKSNFRAKPKS